MVTISVSMAGGVRRQLVPNSTGLDIIIDHVHGLVREWGLSAIEGMKKAGLRN
jgi:hypothetical protein